MHKKIPALCGALVTLGAMAIAPAGASASILKDTVSSIPTALSAGAKITAIGTSTSIFKNNFLSVECNENSITGKVTNAGNDTGGVVEGTIESATFSSNLTSNATDCKSSLGASTIDVTGFPWCLRGGGGSDTFTLFPNDTCAASGGEFEFTITAPLGVSCTYRRTGTITGTITTPGASNSTLLSVTGEPEFDFVSGSGLCGESNFKITKMEFNLYTDTPANGVNTAYTESEKDPVWASVN
jgi:hypothetical protein